MGKSEKASLGLAPPAGCWWCCWILGTWSAGRTCSESEEGEFNCPPTLATPPAAPLLVRLLLALLLAPPILSRSLVVSLCVLASITPAVSFSISLCSSLSVLAPVNFSFSVNHSVLASHSSSVCIPMLVFNISSVSPSVLVSF